MNCSICALNASKYKCPNCKIVYCSIACFKSHKPSDSYSCAKANSDKKLLTLQRNSEKFEELNEEDLGRLMKSESLPVRLKDNNLQNHLIALDKAVNPNDIFEQLKDNQQFQEFCTEILAIMGQ
jgi:hypothetical protein